MKSVFRQFISQYWILLIIIAIKFTLQFTLVNPVYELHRDEFLHLDQANHLAFGYISVPPYTSLVSKVIFLLGGGIFWVRFFPALFGALTIVFAWLIAESLNGNLLSKVVVSLAVTFSVLVRLNILLQPNSFDILAWTILFYLLVRLIKTGKSKYLYWLAVVAAAGFYNKYNIVFLFFGLVAGLLLTPQRRFFTQATMWKAAILFIVLLLPNLAWQAVYHFPVVEHMKVLKANQLDNNSATGFLIRQVMIIFNALPLIIAALAAFVFYKPFKDYRFAGICFVVVILLFSVLKAKDYYAFGLYPALIAFGVVFIEKISSRRLNRFIMPLLIVFNLGIFAITAKLIYPVLSPEEIIQHKDNFEKMGLLRWEDGKNHHLPQDFADMIGWKEMAEKSLVAYKAIPENELKNTLIICDNYGQTGALNYYNRGLMPEAFCLNTDYIFWLPEMQRIENILLVGKKPDPKIVALFRECREVGKIENKFAREKGTEIFLLIGADDTLTQKFNGIVEERKSKMDVF